MRYFFLLLAISCFLLTSSCHNDKDCNRCKCVEQEQNPVGTDTTALVYVPNLFTPNGDGVNDVFHVYGYGIDSLHLQIKDGNDLVFQTTNLNEGWDGSVNGTISVTCQPFDYVLDVYFANGNYRHLVGSVLLFMNDGTFCPDDFQHCRFGNQFDGQGFNNSFSSGEGNC